MVFPKQTFYPILCELFLSTLGLFPQHNGTLFPTRWDFFPKAVGLSSQRGGKEFPPNGTNSLLRGNALKMLGRFEIRRERGGNKASLYIVLGTVVCNRVHR
jgi:hypothetical protein